MSKQTFGCHGNVHGPVILYNKLFEKKSNIFVCSWLFNQMKIVTILDKLIAFLELELKQLFSIEWSLDNLTTNEREIYHLFEPTHVHHLHVLILYECHQPKCWNFFQYYNCVFLYNYEFNGISKYFSFFLSFFIFEQ